MNTEKHTKWNVCDSHGAWCALDRCKSTGCMLYAIGITKPHYPLPALHVDCMSDLGERWSQWIDTMAAHGVRR